ncbi:hypothetical protein AHAS_Ahas14G0127600 [Arachis hypogaea]
MLINKEILNHSIPNEDFIKAYTNNPWIIPIEFLFFNLDIKKDRLEIKQKRKTRVGWIWNHLFQPKKKILKQSLQHQDWPGKRKKKNTRTEWRIMNNIKIYCLLIRLKNNIKEIAISSIQRGELNLDLMANQKSLSLTGLTKKNKLIEKAMFIVEPIRLSREKDEQFYIYQTIVLSLLHKSKRQIKKRPLTWNGSKFAALMEKVITNNAFESHHSPR